MSEFLDRIRTRIATVQLLILKRWSMMLKPAVINMGFMLAIQFCAAYTAGLLRTLNLAVVAGGYALYSHQRGVEDVLRLIRTDIGEAARNVKK